jgi:hypothetical protein
LTFKTNFYAFPTGLESCMEQVHPHEFFVGYRRDMDGSRLQEAVCIPPMPDLLTSLKSRITHVVLPGDRCVVRARADTSSLIMEGIIKPEGLTNDLLRLGRIGSEMLLRSHQILERYPANCLVHEFLEAHPIVCRSLGIIVLHVTPSIVQQGALRVRPLRTDWSNGRLHVTADGVPHGDFLREWTNQRIATLLWEAIYRAAKPILTA